MGKKNHRLKEKGIKIIDPKKIDYTYTGKDDLLDIQSALYSNEKSIDTSKKSNIEKKEIDRIRHDIVKNTKLRAKGRLAGGQSKQSHSSVYE